MWFCYVSGCSDVTVGILLISFVVPMFVVCLIVVVLEFASVLLEFVVTFGVLIAWLKVSVGCVLLRSVCGLCLDLIVLLLKLLCFVAWWLGC